MEEELLSLLRKILLDWDIPRITDNHSKPEEIAMGIGTLTKVLYIIGEYFRRSLDGSLRICILDEGYSHGPSIFYNKSESTIVIRPRALIKDLVLYSECANVDAADALFYVMLHEYGHHKLNLMGINPMDLTESKRYMVIYSKFEDYAISRILMGDTYRRIERKILVYNAKRSCEVLEMSIIGSLLDWHIDYLARTLITKLMDNISTIALADALDYLRLEDISMGIPEKVIEMAKNISSTMRKISKETIRLIPLLAYDSWLRCFV